MPSVIFSLLSSAYLMLLLCLLILMRLHTYETAQIASRYFYGNEESTLNVNTTLNLLDDGRIDAIPMEFYKELDNVTDISEFIDRFVDKDSIDPQLGIQENLKRNVERAASVIPRPANCMPENTIVPLVPLNPSRDPKVLYYPKCTRVKRCSGCCNSDLMSCQPTQTEIINFEVTKYRFGEKTPLRGKEIVVVEQHARCKCDCRIKEQDCNSYQIYRSDQCRCICTNDDARQKCLTQEHKIWDEDICRCVCRESQSCTTGTIFDESQCKCIDINHNEFFE